MAEQYLEGRATILDQAENELERGRISYEEHVRQTIQALNNHFHDVYQHAGMDGEVKLVPSQAFEGEWALYVRRRSLLHVCTCR